MAIKWKFATVAGFIAMAMVTSGWAQSSESNSVQSQSNPTSPLGRDLFRAPAIERNLGTTPLVPGGEFSILGGRDSDQPANSFDSLNTPESRFNPSKDFYAGMKWRFKLN